MKTIKLSIIMAILLLFTVTSYSQVKEDTTQITMGKVYNDVKQAVTGLAAALKVGSEHVYEVLIKQQVVQSITWCVIYILSAIVSLFLWKKIPGIIKKGEESDEYEPWGMLYIPVIIVSVVSLVLLFTTIQQTITGFVNPEYGAMQDILQLIK